MKVSFSDYAAGAVLATDLVNTSALVRSAGEVLTDAAALEEFLREHDVNPGSRLVDGDLRRVHALRQQVRALLESSAEDEVVDGANALLAGARTAPTLARDAEDRWQWHLTTPADTPLADEIAALIGAGLLGALRTLGYDRFRHCASPTCDGMFVDTSRAGRRRYCMPELCGNRLNVANHRARRRERRVTD